MKRSCSPKNVERYHYLTIINLTVDIQGSEGKASMDVPMSLRIGQGILDSQPCSSDSHVIRFVPDLSHYV